MNRQDEPITSAISPSLVNAPSTATHRVAFLDHTARLGGGEIALLNLVIALDRTRYEPVVVLFSTGPLELKLRAAGVETHVLPLSDRVGDVRKDSLGFGVVLKLFDVYLALKFCWSLSRWLRRNDIRLVHCNSLKSDILGGIAARLAGKPCVWHIRDRISEDYLPTPVVKVFRLLCRWVPTTLVSNSAATAGTLGDRNLSIVVHDGTMLPSIESARHDGDRLLVGLIGRITWWKGQDIFIRAAAIVRRRFPQARFQIIGSALFAEKQYDESIRVLAKELQVDDMVEFVGFREDIGAALSELDLVVHASTTGEPFGQVVIEGMAAGKAVVATNGGGVPEILTPECGILVPMKDVAALATAIETLLADPQQRQAMGLAGRERVRRQFLIEHTAEKLAKVFDGILKIA